MSKLKPLTHEEHLALAAEFKGVMRGLISIRNTVWESCGVSSRASKTIEAAIKKLDISFRSEMDKYYHRVTNNEQFIQHGHAYYGERED